MPRPTPNIFLRAFNDLGHTIAAWLVGSLVLLVTGGSGTYFIAGLFTRDIGTAAWFLLLAAGFAVLVAAALLAGWVALRIHRGWSAPASLSLTVFWLYFYGLLGASFRIEPLVGALLLAGVVLLPRWWGRKRL